MVFASLFVQRVDQVLHVDAHGVAGAGLVPLHQEIKDQAVIRHGDLLHMQAVLGNLQDLIDRAVNDGNMPSKAFPTAPAGSFP